ncbi:MAG: Ig-like domain-containing protein, partial [Actinomycetota bacterium]
LSCSYPSPMLVGDTTTLTIPVDVGAGTAGTVTASAVVTGDQVDPNLADNTDSEDTTVNAPSADLSVTKVDELLVDNNNNGQADEGDTLRYRVTIINGLLNSLNNMVFDDTLDSNTTLSGTIHISPLAFADSYTAIGATLNVPAATGVLLNDADPDNSVFNSVVAVNGLPGAVGSSTATSEGGTVTVAANGGFDYTSPVGFEGTDMFTYTLSDGDPLTRDDIETVTITVTNNSNANDQAAPQAVGPQNAVGTASVLNQSIGSVESGQEIEVVFDVTINSPAPASGEVCNQATVTAVNAGPVVSDDPDTAAQNDATCTTVEIPPVGPS